LETGYLPPISLTGLTDQALPADNERESKPNRRKLGHDKHPFEKWETR